ncbi:hypothetical protein Tco_0104558 [Tanacetum coccineum]
MSTLAEFMILSGGENRPPMLEKHLYDSWKSRMELYMQNREHGRMILESVEHDPLIWPTIEENGVTRIKKYEELSVTEKIQADCDLKATNIILQGLSSDVYSLERECKLYDAFDKFAHIKGESLHQYYLRFTQLINDMNIYKMKLEQFQVNTKFLNSLPPEWSKFVTDVKLIRDLHTTNFDQLHAYLEQYKLHANEVRLMRERNQDPLALVTNQHMTPPHFNTYQSSYNNPQQQATIHDRRVAVQPIQGRQSSFAAGTSGTRANISGTAKAVLMANLSSYESDVLSEVPHSENTHNDMLNQSVQEMPYSEQTHLVKYPENEITTVQDTNSSTQQDAMILSVFEQLSNQVTNCNKVNKDNLIANESLSVELERYKIREKNAQFADFEKEINYLKQTISEQSKENELLTKTFNVFKNESKKKETKNIDKEIALEKKVKELDNIKAQQIRPMLYDGSFIAKETNVISISDSEETLMLEEEKDFGKCLVPQQELSDEQAFRLQTSHPNNDQSASSPVKIEAPRELPKVSLVNTSLKKLKYHLDQFDNVVKKRIMPDALTEGE